jgi:hypothetical protein
VTPVAVDVVNGMSGSKVDQARTKGILRTVLDGSATRSRPTIVGGVEFGNITEHPVLDNRPNYLILHDPTTSARAGSLLAVDVHRVKVLSYRWKIGCPREYRGRKADRMQTRYLLVAKVLIDAGTPQEWRTKVVVGHAPPKRNWFLRGLFMSRVAAQRAGIVLADWNSTPTFVARALKRDVRMVGVLGLALRHIIRVVSVWGYDVNADHLAVRALLRRPARRKEK